jgi:hypothetical protein
MSSGFFLLRLWRPKRTLAVIPSVPRFPTSPHSTTVTYATLRKERRMHFPVTRPLTGNLGKPRNLQFVHRLTNAAVNTIRPLLSSRSERSERRDLRFRLSGTPWFSRELAPRSGAAVLPERWLHHDVSYEFPMGSLLPMQLDRNTHARKRSCRPSNRP